MLFRSWMETKKPILSQAREFSLGVHAVYPQQWLAYNLSPSFNWDAAGLGTKDMKDYVWELGKLGFVWQFITVSLGFFCVPFGSIPFFNNTHANGDILARRFALQRLYQ